VAFRKRIDRKLDKSERNFETEQLMKEKRSEEREVLEDVFDVNNWF
jgi:hypothetical protein